MGMGKRMTEKVVSLQLKVVSRVHRTSSKDIKYKIGHMLCKILHNHKTLITPPDWNHRGGVDRHLTRGIIQV